MKPLEPNTLWAWEEIVMASAPKPQAQMLPRRERQDFTIGPLGMLLGCHRAAVAESSTSTNTSADR
jgi:hypothetical protein